MLTKTTLYNCNYRLKSHKIRFQPILTKILDTIKTNGGVLLKFGAKFNLKHIMIAHFRALRDLSHYHSQRVVNSYHKQNEYNLDHSFLSFNFNINLNQKKKINSNIQMKRACITK